MTPRIPTWNKNTTRTVSLLLPVPDAAAIFEIWTKIQEKEPWMVKNSVESWLSGPSSIIEGYLNAQMSPHRSQMTPDTNSNFV